MAKLDLPEDEKEILSNQLDRLIEGFSALETLDTRGVEPLSSVLDIHNILRDDVVKKSFTRDEILSNAPEQYDGCFQVPKTLD